MTAPPQGLDLRPADPEPDLPVIRIGERERVSSIPGGSKALKSDDVFATDEDEWPEGVGVERRRARAVVIQVLYEVDVTGHVPSAVLERRILEDRTPHEASAYARRLLPGVIANLGSIDETLTKGAPGWPVDRMDVVERAILRLAVHELSAAVGVPVRVAINEAVELAKVFGHEPSAKFVNGVLGAVARAITPLLGTSEEGLGAIGAEEADRE
ncbi:MAG: transcription antitermination factor NusB [Proteobacteria bacterium]|jgi:N utilization substance protein B|nr:transcription antitermination factor NusB [Pseudomonadota bacterium]NBT93887.1 transcription antitermination factor NusB [Chloroflexota bacterium]NBQ33088.1 transcription antitermination factor NusB [Pseudomonadota bacterium]NBT02270.1 transcription antitermination factor NusB [Pseudomonadota bacterium]NBT19509.1 transcription antitermination factor NusB [Pseudomonadota bacterium]